VNGTSVSLKGSVANSTLLPPGAAQGDLYVILNAGGGYNAGDGAVSDGLGGWSNVGPIQGPQGLSGYSGVSGWSGTSGIDGASGYSGVSGWSGTSGIDGTSGYSGVSGWSGTSGIDGTSGYSGVSGWSGTSGIDGTSGYSGISGWSGTSGIDGASGYSGVSGWSGTSGIDGASGYSGVSGWSGTSGIDGASGYSGVSGWSGTSGIDGQSGYSGISGWSGTSGIDGASGYSGWSGISGIDGTSGYSGVTPAIGGSDTQVQYNSSGSLAGSANLVFDGTTITAANLKISAPSLALGANTTTGINSVFIGANVGNTSNATATYVSGGAVGDAYYILVSGLSGVITVGMTVSGTGYTSNHVVTGLALAVNAVQIQPTFDSTPSGTLTFTGRTGIIIDSGGVAYANGQSIAIGSSAASNNQCGNSIAIGTNAGFLGQGGNSIAIGIAAGNSLQSTNSIAIGTGAAANYQSSNAVAIGRDAGSNSQGYQAIAIGYFAGNSTQGQQTIAIGSNAGMTTQGTFSVAIGTNAGMTTSSTSAVAIGVNAGSNAQGQRGIAIGSGAGSNAQGAAAIAIGRAAGGNTQGGNSVAIGSFAGNGSQGISAVAIGINAGIISQGNLAVAIGANAGYTTQGLNAVAIGRGAGLTNQAANSIIINGTGVALEQTTTNTFTVKPVRAVANPGNVMFYNTTTGEISYDVQANVVAGTVSVAAQPNITSVGNLTSLTAANANLGNLVTANFFSGDGSSLTNLTGGQITGEVANAAYATLAGGAYAVDGANVSGDVATANYAAYAGNVTIAGQGNITSVGLLSNASISGNLVLANATNHGIQVDTTTPVWGWRDILGQLTIRGGGAQDPSWVVYRGVIYQYQCTLNDEVTISFHLPHDYVPGTDIYAHTHWSLNGAGITQNCTWEFSSVYAKGHDQEAFSAVTVTSILQASSTTQYQHMIAETPISSAAGTAGVLYANSIFEVDGLIIMRVKLSANSGTGTGTSRPFLHMVDLHYQSTNMATKGKAPAFY
jgi:hypothetical protein